MKWLVKEIWNCLKKRKNGYKKLHTWQRLQKLLRSCTKCLNKCYCNSNDWIINNLHWDLCSFTANRNNTFSVWLSMLRNKEVKCDILYALHGSSMFRSLLRSSTTCSRFQMGVSDTKQGLTYFDKMKTVYPCYIPFRLCSLWMTFRVHGFTTPWPNPKIWKCLIHIINNNVSMPFGRKVFHCRKVKQHKKWLWKTHDNKSKKFLKWCFFFT